MEKPLSGRKSRMLLGENKVSGCIAILYCMGPVLSNVKMTLVSADLSVSATLEKRILRWGNYGSSLVFLWYVQWSHQVPEQHQSIGHVGLLGTWDTRGGLKRMRCLKLRVNSWMLEEVQSPGNAFIHSLSAPPPPRFNDKSQHCKANHLLNRQERSYLYTVSIAMGIKRNLEESFASRQIDPRRLRKIWRCRGVTSICQHDGSQAAELA